MSIASEITRLQGVKSDILTAIGNKGVTVPVGSALDDCPELIASIPTGSDDAIIGGRQYTTVTIGSQTWLKENLDFLVPGAFFGYVASSPFASYYNNDKGNSYGLNGTYKVGMMYNIKAIQMIEQHKEQICPGWHVPTKEDVEALLAAVGSNPGTKLKAANNSVTGSWPEVPWNGTDDYGFGATPGGYTNDQTTFMNFGNGVRFWTQTAQTLNTKYYTWEMNDNDNNVVIDYQTVGSMALYLRLVHD